MRQFLRAKIHRATVTGADIEYEGSFGIDSILLRKVGILPYEAIEVYNITNGQRLKTYAISLPEGSGRFESNGAAAHLIRPGDRVIIAAYTYLQEEELQYFRGPKILVLGKDNTLKTFYEAKIFQPPL